MLLIGIASLLQVSSPYLTKIAIDNYIAHGDLAGLNKVVLVYLAIILLGFLLGYLQTYIMQLTGQRIMFDLRMEIYRHLQRLDVAFYDRNPVGRLMTRMTNDIESLNEMFAQGAITLIADVFKMVAIAVVMLVIDAPMALLTFATLPLMFILVEYARRLMRASFRQIRVRLAAMNAFAQEHLSGIRVVQLLGRAKTAQHEYNEINAGHRDAYLGQIRADAAMYAIVEAIATVSVAAAIWYAAGHRTTNIAMIGVVVMFIDYINKFFIPVRDLSQKYAVMQGAMAASERIFQLLDTEEWDGPKGEHDLTVKSESARTIEGGPAVELAGVHFSYGAEPVLRGVDVKVPRGSTVAVVTGSTPSE